MGKPIKNLTNEKFGKLTAISFNRIENHRTYWNCLCDCGKNKIVGRDELQYGYTKSCGCIISESRKKVGIGSRKDVGHAPFYKILIMYQRNAAARNIEWNITDVEFKLLIKGNCNYCGEVPSTKVNPNKNWSEEWKKLNILYYNGIDRIDNNSGYVLNNCVSCCKLCNRAKGDITIDDFNKWLIRLINYNKKILELKG